MRTLRGKRLTLKEDSELRQLVREQAMRIRCSKVDRFATIESFNMVQQDLAMWESILDKLETD